MLKWQVWDRSSSDWDILLQSYPNYTVFQSYAWGDHKARFGWSPLRLVLRKGDAVCAMAQVLIRHFPFGLGIVWVPGGPLGQINLFDNDFRKAIQRAAGLTFLYCRINFMQSDSTDNSSALSVNGWQKCPKPLLSGLSLSYQPMIDEETRLQMSSGNWRHNYRRSAKRGLAAYLWKNPDPEVIMSAYVSMQKYKQLREQVTLAEVASLISLFSNRCLIVRCDDEQGNLLALRGALTLGGKGWDTFAAATPAGRKVYASHAAFWELMRQCANEKIEWYDMGGVDPEVNKGVYDFKKGVGGLDLRYLGEWDYAKPSILASLARHIIAERKSS